MAGAGSPEPFPQTAPVFPLPTVVLFPSTILPLHIFEPRYRAMIADAERGDGCIAMSLLKAGWERDYEGNPDYCEVGCLGRITSLQRTEDGRYHLKLVGLRKVALGDLVGSSPYRTARIQPIAETIPDNSTGAGREDLVRLFGACTVLVQEMAGESTPMVTLGEHLPYETVVNSVCAHVGLPPEVKQLLLEIDEIRERCLKLTTFLEAHLQKVVLSRAPGAPGRPPGPIH
ncbi:MAG: LON peptidase substrate-binding domain-containing protein [Acidobacteria bacterium]|nr:LON peptidase substrate-binding domain-containing protein [Acidobacteriota bacterium]